MDFDPEDWLDRLKQAGIRRLRIYQHGSFGPGEIHAPSPEIDAVWNEIKGPDLEKWKLVEQALRARTGPFWGWGDLDL